MIKVSVIIPAYGSTPFLPEALEAMRRQTWKNIELIISNPPADSKNPGAARNVGLDKATGDWVMFLDADDLPHPNWVEDAVSAGERTGAEVVVFGADKFDAKTLQREKMPNLLGLRNWSDGCVHNLAELGRGRFTTLGTAPWNKAVRRSILQNHAIRFQSIERADDIAFMVELLAKAETFCALDESLIDYRINHSTSLESGNIRTPFRFLRALREARLRLGGSHRAAYWAFWRETVAYNMRSWFLILSGRGF